MALVVAPIYRKMLSMEELCFGMASFSLTLINYLFIDGLLTHSRGLTNSARASTHERAECLSVLSSFKLKLKEIYSKIPNVHTQRNNVMRMYL